MKKKCTLISSYSSSEQHVPSQLCRYRRSGLKSYSGLDLCHISYSAPNRPPCVLTESAEFQSGVGSLRLVGSSLNSIRSECVLRSVLRISRHTADSVKTHDLLRIENRLEISRRFAHSGLRTVLKVQDGSHSGVGFHSGLPIPTCFNLDDQMRSNHFR